MKKLQALIVFIFFTSAFAATLQAQAKVFSSAQGSGKNQAYYEFDKWNFSVGGDRYEIAKNGTGKRTDGKNKVTNLKFVLEEGEHLRRVIYFAQYKNDLLLLSETDDGESGVSFIVRLDGQTLKTKWRRTIPGFNIAPGLVENRFAYVAAIGFVAKINLGTGKYVWKHDNIYRKYEESGAFNIFEASQLKNSSVIFKEEGKDNKIEVNRMSGKIIRVSLN